MTMPVDRLRTLLASGDFLVMPCCYDALSARLVEMAGFPLTFMSGFAVAATRLALPDTGLISYGEMCEQGRNICAAVSIPVLGDGDTGYGNEINVRRTVQGYARAGFACVMIEDQQQPKRCGHLAGKEVVGRKAALSRIRAAVEARNEGADILIMARTDARATHGLDEALWRCDAFVNAGVDIVFLEAPQSVAEMRAFCEQIPGPKMANMVEGGLTPIVPPAELAAMGYSIAAYPLTLLGVAVQAMQKALADLQAGVHHGDLMDFENLKRVVGLDEYQRLEKRYAVGRVSGQGD